MNKQFIVTGVILFLIFGCKKETELSKSIFVKDPENTELPVYSEWGYNTFGVYYDRLPFISTSGTVPSKIIVHENSTMFQFLGQTEPNSYYDYSNSKLTLAIKFNGYLPTSYQQLIQLNDSLFNLKDPSCHISLIKDGTEETLTILNGQLHIKRTQNLFVDNINTEVILSGTFQFQALLKNNPVTFSEGRFDVGISEDNFYNY